ncbi:MAG: glycosyltransferase family 4 protein [Candidatus Omnitrophica bacterium]|nr:glycosyltransferase family 4 protein [Candidatus Omnitrophota bacterium]
MKILFVSSDRPLDLDVYVHGLFQRMRLLMDAMKEIAQIHILFYEFPDHDLSQASTRRIEEELSAAWNIDFKITLCPMRRYPYENPMKNFWPGIFDFCYQRSYYETSGPDQIKAFEEMLDRKPDWVFVHRLRSSGPVMKTKKDLPPVVLDLDDIEHQAYLRYLNRPPSRRNKLLYYAHVPSLFWGEYRAIRKAYRTLICSENDKRYLEGLGLSGIERIPNAVRIPPEQPLTESPTLMFMGPYVYPPNVYAVEFLIRDIWPAIHHEMPEAKLLIAGQHPEEIRYYGDDIPGVEYLGFVKDLQALYRKTRIVCCPVQMGGGTRIKILEGASYGKPIVCTTVGAEGIGMRDGEEILLCDHAWDFAKICLELLRNHEQCEKLGRKAQAFVREHYTREKVIRKIQEVLRIQGS